MENIASILKELENIKATGEDTITILQDKKEAIEEAAYEVQENTNEVTSLMETLESLDEAVELLWGSIDNAEEFLG